MGSKGSLMNCSDIAELAPLYASGELDGARASKFAAHLHACPGCEQEIEQQRRFDSRLRESVLAESVDTSALEARVRAKIVYGDVAAPPRHFWQLAIAAAVLLMVAAGVGYKALVSARVPQVFADAADDHRDEIIAKQPRRWLSDRSAIEALAARQNVPMTAIDSLESQGYHLEKAKVCELDNQRYLHLVYSSNAQEYSVFLRRADGKSVGSHPKEVVNGRPIYESDRGNLHVASFQAPAINGLVVADSTAEAAIRAAEIASRGL